MALFSRLGSKKSLEEAVKARFVIAVLDEVLELNENTFLIGHFKIFLVYFRESEQ